jgi:hypothetical protein
LAEKELVMPSKTRYTPQFFGPKAFGSVFDLLRKNLGWEEEPLTKKLSALPFEAGYVFAFLPRLLSNNEQLELSLSEQTDPSDPLGGRKEVWQFTQRFLQTTPDSLALFISDLLDHDPFFQNLAKNSEARSPQTLTPYYLVGSANQKDRFVGFFLKPEASTWEAEVGYRTSRGRGAICVLTTNPLAKDLTRGQIVSDELLSQFARQTEYVVFHILCDSYLVWCRQIPGEALLLGPSGSE